MASLNAHLSDGMDPPDKKSSAGASQPPAPVEDYEWVFFSTAGFGDQGGIG